MKKKLQNILTGIIVSIAIFISLISVEVAYAADTPEENTYFYEYYTYTLENDEATIIRANPYNGNVTIPSEVDGYPVVAIAENAYEGVGLYDYITIPESVKRIAPRAFAKAHIHGDLYIYHNLEVIGEEAFKDADIDNVYFAGTEEEFGKINIDSGNESILEAEMYYKFDFSKKMFESSIQAGFSGVTNFAQFLFVGLAMPIALLIMPPAGIAALFAPIAGAEALADGFLNSWEFFEISIAVLFA